MRSQITCSSDDCSTPARVKGLCHRHLTIATGFSQPQKRRTDKVCQAAYCAEVAIARGLCERHYRGRKPREPLFVRLMEKVTFTEGCWLWNGAVNGDGYGNIGIGDGRTDVVHRVAYRIMVGEIPDGLQLDHVWARGCRHRNCVNPDHLEAVTPFVNTSRSVRTASQTA